MKIISSCERQFIENSIISRQKRLDGRQLLESRTLEIIFGKERGCCIVLQGNTRILAQVSCEVTEPKASTPTEGILHLNLELSAMANPDVKAQQSRSSDDAIETQRSLERCIRDSKCIDLESLCIITGTKVWTVRVDIHALNDDGNLLECASIAAVSALAHFRRPEVSVVGTDVTVHSLDERESVALNLHHMPISINLALFEQGKFILVDPTEMEEKISEGCYIIGMNAHQEICFVHRRGVLLMAESTVQKCEDVAVKHAQEVTQVIRKALDDDAYKRATNAPVGFTNLIQTSNILGGKRPIAEFNFDSVRKEKEVEESVEVNEVVDISDDWDQLRTSRKSSARLRAMQILQDSEASLFEGGRSKWGVEESDEDESSNETPEKKPNISNTSKQELDIDDEEEPVYMGDDEVDTKPEVRKWYSKDAFL